jgi:phage/plasmid-like protein (TIGR03299 family)
MGLGTNVTLLPDHPAPEDVLAEAGLNWRIEERQLFTGPGERLNGWRAMVRDDTNDVLHVAKDSYTVIQNEVGAEIMEALLSGSENVKYETGGSVKGGTTCYLTARIDEDMRADGDDSATFPYVVVLWGHDGMTAMQARVTNVRVVCQNTISFSEADAQRSGRRWTFRHAANYRARIDEAKKALSGAREEAKAFQALANELARISVTKEQRELFVSEVMIPEPVGNVISDRVRGNIEAARDEIRLLLSDNDNAVTIPEAHKGTAYGLLLAGTEYLDHLRGARSSDTYLGRTLLREESLKAKLVPAIRELVAA